MAGKTKLEKHPELADRIYELAKQGKTDKQIADLIGTTDRTLNRWKVSDVIFASVLKENKNLADQMVEKALYQRATGYDYKERTITDKGVYEHDKHAPPDPTSMIFWLKNRKSKEWRDKVEVDNVNPFKVIVNLPDGKEEL